MKLPSNKTLEGLMTRLMYKTQYTLVRNLRGVVFPRRIVKEAREVIVERIEKILTEDFAKIPELEAELCLEVLGPDFDAGLYELADADGELPEVYRRLAWRTKDGILIWVELGCANWITISIMDNLAMRGEEIIGRLKRFAQTIETKLDLAYMPEAGYLSAQLSLTGTGLRVRSWVHVPAICFYGYVDEAIATAEQYEQLVEVQDEAPTNAPIGDILLIFNESAIKHSTLEQLRIHQKCLATFAKCEEEMKQRMVKEDALALYNRVCTARTLMQTQHMVSVEELMDQFSMIRLGVLTGAVTLDSQVRGEVWVQGCFVTAKELPAQAVDVFMSLYGESKILGRDRRVHMEDVCRAKEWGTFASHIVDVPRFVKRLDQELLNSGSDEL